MNIFRQPVCRDHMKDLATAPALAHITTEHLAKRLANVDDGSMAFTYRTRHFKPSLSRNVERSRSELWGY
jgi:hypothetical protein